MASGPPALSASEPGLYLLHHDCGFVAYLVAAQARLSLVRHLTEEILAACGVPADTAAAAQLVLSELVGNAVRACGDDVPVVVEVYASGTQAVVSVHDPLPDLLPEPSESAMDSDMAESGRGLHLLGLLCTDITVSPSPIGKQIRCVLGPG
ncbi:ATP-binding protein [Streptomyces yaizuensis]|uniref:ATP-binding protein n=1 Tax=Streptomyces yaizuensis TaxID=2989713 RepID=A0ABQ5P6H8_9ACTN|nr:ATP-binding protein [Streptomyces sp. YSPA8]GLF98186.1 ATP-binding protein [Streptomyces sp. YSPA8]